MSVTTAQSRPGASPAEERLRAGVRDQEPAPSLGPSGATAAPAPQAAVPVPPGTASSRTPRSAPIGRPPALDASHLRRTARTATPGRDPGRVRDGAPLADPTATCCAVARTALEVLRGERPVAQLARWLTPDVHEALARRARLLVAGTTPAATHEPITIRRARTVRLGPSSAEASVVLETDGRVRAAALRVEEHRGAWRVTALEIG